MRVILDTNILVSGIFFSGPPARILEAWREGKIQIVVSEAILKEYRAVGMRLAAGFKGVDIEPFLNLVSLTARLYRAPALPTQICDDPDDDKFIACALASGTRIIVTGDRSLLRVSGYRGIKILTARESIEKYIRAAT